MVRLQQQDIRWKREAGAVAMTLPAVFPFAGLHILTSTPPSIHPDWRTWGTVEFIQEMFDKLRNSF